MPPSDVPQPWERNMGKRKPANADLLVKAKDCYDPVDYYMVHKVYFDGMRAALREAHKRINDEWGGDTSGCVCIYCAGASSDPTTPDGGK